MHFIFGMIVQIGPSFGLFLVTLFIINLAPNYYLLNQIGCCSYKYRNRVYLIQAQTEQLVLSHEQVVSG